MTAVEWLLENLISEPYSEEDFKYNSECWDKAKEMEKEQIVTAHYQGYRNDIGTTEVSEQYYNKNFKSE